MIIIQTNKVILLYKLNKLLGIILRKGIGEESFDYSQTFNLPVQNFNLTEEELIPFSYFKPANLWIKQNYETPYLPSGFIFKLQLLTNWGDNELIGLNGITFFDQLNRVIFDYTIPKVGSYPLNRDSKEQNINNILNTNNKKIFSWATRYINKNLSNNELVEPTSLYFVFDRPVTLSKIIISNYTINPIIGVKDFTLSCDDSIIYYVILTI